MTTESTVPPQAAPQAAPSESAADFGAILRVAREGASMDVPTLAARLRLHPKQIEALERCDLGALPSLIYVRGFLRSCARELKIDPRPLLEDLDRRAGVETNPTPEPSSGPSFRLARFGDGTKPIVAVLLLVLLLAGLVGTLIPRRPSPPPAKSAVSPPQPSATASATPSAALPPAANANAALASSAPQGSQLPEPQAPAASATIADSRASLPGELAGASLAAAPGQPGSAVRAAVQASRAGENPELVLHVHAQAWVEVVQSDGTTLLSQICAPGTVQTIKGKEPLRVVIGNPGGVEVQFRGAPVDLIRYATPNGVARLTLE